jgi:hypothetical protein
MFVFDHREIRCMADNLGLKPDRLRPLGFMHRVRFFALFLLLTAFHFGDAIPKINDLLSTVYRFLKTFPLEDCTSLF